MMKGTTAALLARVEAIYKSQKSAEGRAAQLIEMVHPKQKESLINLIHYLALRKEDLRPLQDLLHDAGLSSLASAEGHILKQVQAVIERLGGHIPKAEAAKMDAAAGTKLLQHRADFLFGPKKIKNIPHLMVTFESALADDYAAVGALIKAGMNIARINSAHDNAEVWQRMIANVRKASRATHLPCKIYFDLAGPKIRTVLLGKGRKKGRMQIREQEQFFLAETEADFDKKKKVIGCTLGGVVKDLRKGHRILFDDGLYEAVVESPGLQMATLTMIRVSTEKPRLKPEKGINFPDTALQVRSLTAYDKSLIPFARQHADMLGFSFVRTAADVEELQQLLRHPEHEPLPIVIKIETVEAVQNLPSLLVQGMQEASFAVMIARGDLAVEIGFERLSEVQEEILWLAESAHVPVIWATQVLETLNKSGIATRSEVSDAVRAAQAECVMLNKGKFLLRVMTTLKDILQRSGGHHVKKRYVFRSPRIAEHFLRSLDR